MLRKGLRRGSFAVRRSLIVTNGKLLPLRRKPFNYVDRTCNKLHYLFYRTLPRLTPNSKLIHVEGNLASGKTSVAKEIAHTFGMLYLPDYDLYSNGLDKKTGFDWASTFRDIVPSRCEHAFFNHRQFLKTVQKNEECNYLIRPLLQLWAHRYEAHFWALNHIAHTGQGVVMDNSFQMIMSHIHTLYHCGYLNYETMLGFKQMFMQAEYVCIQPHIIVYMDQTPEEAAENIIKRGRELEVKSGIYDADYTSELAVQQKRFLDKYSKRSEIMYLNDDLRQDFAYFTETMARLDLESDSTRLGTVKFEQWGVSERSWGHFKLNFSPQRLKKDIPTRLNVKTNLAASGKFWEIDQASWREIEEWKYKYGIMNNLPNSEFSWLPKLQNKMNSIFMRIGKRPFLSASEDFKDGGVIEQVDSAVGKSHNGIVTFAPDYYIMPERDYDHVDFWNPLVDQWHRQMGEGGEGYPEIEHLPMTAMYNQVGPYKIVAKPPEPI